MLSIRLFRATVVLTVILSFVLPACAPPQKGGFQRLQRRLKNRPYPAEEYRPLGHMFPLSGVPVLSLLPQKPNRAERSCQTFPPTGKRRSYRPPPASNPSF